MEALIQLSVTDLGFALGLMAIAIALSVWQQLGLAGQLALATGRMIIQLLALGYILTAIFEWRNPIPVGIILLIMVSIAALVTRNRIGKKIPRLFAIVWAAIAISSAFILAYVNFLIIQPERWYEPQYVIPLAGMILGSAMNGAALAGERLNSALNSSQLEIETHLSLGATPQQAIAQYRRDAIKAGLIPTLNQMLVAGIVTIPGMMTGQLLSGVDPLNAASYQILVMLMIALANLLTTLWVTAGLYRQYFNQNAQYQVF